MKSVGIYKLDDELKIHAQSETKDGFLIATNPFFNISVQTDPRKIDDFIIEALSHSKRSLPNPKDWQEFGKLFLSGLQVKSLKELNARASFCMVAYDARSFVVTPHRRLGANEGFEPMEREIFSVPNTETKGLLAVRVISILS